MGQCNRPTAIGQPVDAPPYTWLHPGTKQAREKYSHHEIESHCSQSHPKSTVGRRKGHDDGQPPDMYIRVEDAGENVDGQEDNRQHREPSMELLLSESRPVAGSGSRGRGDAKEHGAGQQDERDDATGPSDVPE
jgi:hypothetical protein